MDLREIGRSGLKTGPLAFGGNVFGWTADRATSFALLDRFVDAGLNLIDTADVYSRWAPGHQGGESESIIGAWLKHGGKRQRVLIATKVGMDMGEDRKGLSSAHIIRSVEASLRRLQTDVIDLYQAHADDPATPLAETLGAFGDLVKQGKVRAIGASNYTAERLAEARRTSAAHDLPRYECLQPHYNLYERAGYEAALEPLCRAETLGVISYFSLASGFLSGKYRSEADFGKSVRGGGMKAMLNDRGHRILGALDAIALQYGCTQSQAALAWLIARPGITAPIVSATSVGQLDEVLGAITLRLDTAAIAALDAASA